MNLTKVFIVILNHNGHEHSIECLESVYKLDYPNVQILLVDNSPSAASVNAIIEWANGNLTLKNTLFPDLVLPYINKPVQYRYLEESYLAAELNYQEKLIIIKANENAGFASGNNIALKYIQDSNTDCFIWLLNNDTVVKKDSLTQLVNYYHKNQANGKIGLIGSKLLYYYKPEAINGIGGIYNKWMGIASHLGESEIDSGQYDLPDQPKMQYIIGASMFFSKKFLLEIGLLNEDYFLFFEELDWAYRGKVKGWDIGFEHNSIVYHKESASISPERTKSQLFETAFLASRIIFSLKYSRFALGYIYFTIIPMLINRARRRQFSRILPLISVAINPFGFKKSVVNKLKYK